jgi:hypothetical protein
VPLDISAFATPIPFYNRRPANSTPRNVVSRTAALPTRAADGLDQHALSVDDVLGFCATALLLINDY